MLVIALILLFVTYFGNFHILGQSEIDGFETTLTNSTTIQQDHETSKYTREERIAIEQLRKSLTATDADLISKDKFYQSDNFLIRFLRSRDNNVEAAHQLLVEVFAWRAENKLDTILSENIYNVSNPNMYYYAGGHDNDGRPLIQFFFFNIDLRKLLIHGKQRLVLRYYHQFMEQRLEYLKTTKDRLKNGDEVTDFTVIHDCSGFSVRAHACIPCIKAYFPVVLIFRDYYSEAFANYVVVNVPPSMLPVIKTFYSILSERVQKKFEFFGVDKKEWSEYLLSKIPKDQLLERFGGSKVI